MNTKELDFRDMIKNVKKNYKLALVIVCACIAAGAIAGIVSAKTYSPENAGKVSEFREHVNIEGIEKNGGYYYNAIFELKEKKDYISAYLQYFEQVDISLESRATLDDVQKHMDEYDEMYENAKDFYEENALVVAGQNDSAIEFYNDKIEELNDEAESLNEKLSEVVNGRYTDDYKDSQQKSISGDISEVQSDIDMFEEQINMISSADESATADSAAEFDKIRADNASALNGIIDEFNDAMTELAKKENYEIVYNDRLINGYFEKAGFNGEMEQEEVLSNQLGKAIVYAKSIAGLDIPKERFFATFTFFILFGVVIAFIAAAVRTPPKMSKEK